MAATLKVFPRLSSTGKPYITSFCKTACDVSILKRIPSCEAHVKRSAVVVPCGYRSYTTQPNSCCHFGNRPIEKIFSNTASWYQSSNRVSILRHFSSFPFCRNFDKASSFPVWIKSNCLSTTAPADLEKPFYHGIQKDVSSLKTKRTVRRKISNDELPRKQEYFNVIAYALAEEYNLEALRDAIVKQGLYNVIKLPEDAYDALHVEAKYKVDNERRGAFFFREGSIVFWNMQEEEQQTFLSFIRPYQSGTYDSVLTKEELEKFEFTYTDNKTAFVGGDIHLRSAATDGDRLAQQLEMFAFSNALSLSVKLAIWEASLEKYVDSIEFVLQDLKNGKKIRMSEASVLQKAGELFALSHLINLSSDLLDTPDFYWDRDDLERIYRITCNHLNITRRTKVMNDKLRQCVDLTELLRDHLKDEHHTRLELMIIFLIMIEVIFQIFHLIEKYYLGKKDPELAEK